MHALRLSQGLPCCLQYSFAMSRKQLLLLVVEYCTFSRGSIFNGIVMCSVSSLRGKWVPLF
jgi:hypothetical protein